MKPELDSLLRSGVRRELRDPPAGLPARVQARLGETPVLGQRPGRGFPFGLLASAAAAGLLATAFWPGGAVSPVRPAPAAPSPLALAGVLTREGIQLAARIERPLAAEWQLMVQDTQRLYGELLGQLPRLPR
jgi:hypothetical protein